MVSIGWARLAEFAICLLIAGAGLICCAAGRDGAGLGAGAIAVVFSAAWMLVLVVQAVRDARRPQAPDDARAGEAEQDTP
jgi:hypothetical protein